MECRASPGKAEATRILNFVEMPFSLSSNASKEDGDLEERREPSFIGEQQPAVEGQLLVNWRK
jgi:hypothetical protein